MSVQIEHGNFTELALNYRHRAGYSERVLEAIVKVYRTQLKLQDAADVGAGTGKLTQHLTHLGLNTITAVEPNEAMRNEGILHTKELGISWVAGSGEDTTLPAESKDWVLMGSSFHWVDLNKGLTEFHRILRPGGIFTAVWNPRDLDRCELQTRIERKVKEMVPNLNRVSSGAPKQTKDWYSLLESTKQFKDCLFIEAKHEEHMSPERYMGLWKSVNDIQVQAGPERWQDILKMIESEIDGLDQVVVPYATRAWTVTKV